MELPRGEEFGGYTSFRECEAGACEARGAVDAAPRLVSRGEGRGRRGRRAGGRRGLVSRRAHSRAHIVL